MKQKGEKEDLITALYCRLSVDDIPDADAMDSRRLKEEMESNRITHQEKYLEDFAKARGFRNIRYFTDNGYTGTNFNRHGFSALLEEINAGNVGIVCIVGQETGTKWHQHTFIDEYSRFRCLEAFQEHSTYSSAEFIKHCVQRFPYAVECVQIDN